MFWSFWLVCLSVHRITYKVYNERICMHEIFIRDVAQVKKHLIHTTDDPDYDSDPGPWLRSVPRIGGLQSLTDCPSVRQQDYLQSNERICMHETFIRGVSWTKKQSNKIWGWFGLRSESRIRIAIHITRWRLQSLTNRLVIYMLLVCNYYFASRYLIGNSTLKRYVFVYERSVSAYRHFKPYSSCLCMR